ncbi:MAG TPA: hypothetical protein PLZ93_19490 [Nocardioides sp.]|uniref:hypothetical protein n=1 Tax=uncultured Nocardioides sp. TaxID=198441 RepID=UPI002622712E|nr:hypothetical protein [uncultured Nocardioides sp.]HRI97813.1 hypothetical protein [Nocardioides sp.]HRK47208.1 hypothetical protein [Nocardioides sp.]
MTESTKRWIVRVSLQADTLEDERALPDLDRLRARGAVVNRHPVDGVWEATLSIEAPTTLAATAAASSFVSEVSVGAIDAVEVLRQHVVEP